MNAGLDAARVASLEAAIGNELTELDALIEGTEADGAPVALDQQSVGRLSRTDAMQGQALAQEANRRRLSRRLALQLALRRIEAGEYGDCLDCGEPIAVRRLEVDAAATLCISCAQRADGRPG